MLLSRLFYVCNALVIPGWLLLAAAPRWRWTHRICTFLVPIVLAALYLGLFVGHWNPSISYATLDSVYAIFQDPAFVLIGWMHYLAFDLFIGSWEVRDAQAQGIRHVLVLPCLLATFFIGPVGLLLYLLLKLGMRAKWGAEK